MRTLSVVLVAGVLTTGCAPYLYPGMYPPGRGPYHAPAYHPRQMAPEPTPIGRWDNVMRLPRLSVIDVLTEDGAATIGQLLASTAQSVTLTSDGVPTEIERRQVVRIDLVQLPGSATGAAIERGLKGAVLGVGAAALFSGIIGGDLWPPPGVALRAGAALGAAHAIGPELATRRPRIIYLAR